MGPFTITLMNMSALIDYQTLGSCNYTGLVLFTLSLSLDAALIPHLCLQVKPFLPYEYTCEGMLERLHAYIQNQVGQRQGKKINDGNMVSVCTCVHFKGL